MEEEVYSIKDEIIYQKRREYNLRDTNGLLFLFFHPPFFFFFGSVIHTRRICVTELMNARCAWLPIIAVVAMSISTGAQIYYLRTFFQKKKLI